MAAIRASGKTKTKWVRKKLLAAARRAERTNAPKCGLLCEYWEPYHIRAKSNLYLSMKAENYPQEIKADESSLGFASLFLQADDLNHSQRLFFEFPMVVRLLLPYDIIVKSILFGDVVYIHKRFGKATSTKNQSEIHAEWWSLSEGNPIPQQAIKNAQSGLITAFYASEILPVAFQYRTP